jgi:hypothetical protein
MSHHPPPTPMIPTDTLLCDFCADPSQLVRWR